MSNDERHHQAADFPSAPSGATRVEQRSDPSRNEQTRLGAPRSPVGSTMEAPATIRYRSEGVIVRRDRVRWGPVWAGVLVALGTYLLLQLALVASGAVEVVNPGSGDAVASAIAAGVAFLLGGVVTGASAMWRGLDDGVLHGVVLWAISLVVLLALAGFGSGLALGAFDPTDAFDDLVLTETADPAATDTEVTADDAQEAAGWALLALTVALVATTVGSVAGAKLWPRDQASWDAGDEEIDLRDQDRANFARTDHIDER